MQNNPTSSTNNFFGIKVSKPGYNVANATPAQLLYESNYATQTWYDSSGNATLIQGQLPDGSYGIQQENGGINNINGQITLSNGATPQVVIGQLPDGTYGIWVSKTGVDVKTATPSQLNFNSNQNVFKIVYTGTASVTIPINTFPTQYTTTIPNTLGYIPAIQAYCDTPAFFGAGRVPVPSIWPIVELADNTISAAIAFTVALTTTDIEFGAWGYNPGPIGPISGTYTFSYYLLQESAS